MEQLIKTLVGLNMRLVIGPSDVINHFEVKVIHFDRDNKPIGAHQQVMPTDNHAYDAKVIDCARFCIDKLLEDDKARGKESTVNG